MDADTETIIKAVLTGRDLTREQARYVFDRIMSGQMSPGAIGALLTALANKGECVDEVVGAAQAMRAKAIRIPCDADCIDTCGTGGDGISTFNVSTTAAIIAAGAGATVAKHGNRSTSRISGSTEVLRQLRIDVEADMETVGRCLAEVRIGYLNARLLHPAMRYAAPVRQVIGVRTLFNLLGPLTNPVGVRAQVLGVPRPELLDLMACALLELGTLHAWVVHGADGLCDLTVTGETLVVEVRNSSLHRFTVTPEQAGLPRASLHTLLVNSPQASADTILSILRGHPGPQRDHALLNAGAALVVAGLSASLREGVTLAARAIDNGSAMETLRRWRRIAALGRNGNPR